MSRSSVALTLDDVGGVSTERQEAKPSVCMSQEGMVLALQETVRLQAGKIQRLLLELEGQGATVAWQKTELEEFRQLLQERERALAEAQAKVQELTPWRDMGHARLGPTFELANHQIDVFRSYVTALESPGHRLVSFVGRKVGRGPLGRLLRRSVYMVIALRRA